MGPRWAYLASPRTGVPVTKGVQDLMVEVERVRDAFDAAVYPDGDAAMVLATPGCTTRTVRHPHRPAPRGAGDPVVRIRRSLVTSHRTLWAHSGLLGRLGG